MKSSQPEKISVVIVDDHRMFREHLGHLIDKSGDMVVCGEADNVEDGFALIKEKRPSVAILDISLKRGRAVTSPNMKRRPTSWWRCGA